LIFDAFSSLCDGAAEVSSFGILDSINCPPIDTWFYFDGVFLLAWIPKQLVEYVNQGIEVNPELCISWLKEENSALYQALMSQSLQIKACPIQNLPNNLQR